MHLALEYTLKEEQKEVDVLPSQPSVSLPQTVGKFEAQNCLECLCIVYHFLELRDT